MRELATIQRITSIEPIAGADSIMKATVLGWNVVIRKDEFKVGDMCVYFEIDSLLPKWPEFEFLSKNGTKKMLVDGQEVEGYRLRTVKLRGQVSQGLCLPLSIIPADVRISGDIEGTDLSVPLHVIKYEAPVPANLAGKVRGVFPSYIPKTDEIRIQTCPGILERHKDQTFYVTEKLDGTSMTVFVKDGELHVCSRNLDLLEEEGNTLWRVAREMKLEEKLKDTNVALQGELMGEGIQKNSMKIKGQNWFVFSGYNFVSGAYLSMSELVAFLTAKEIPMVPLVDANYKLPATVDELVEFANGKATMNPEIPREGIVIRSKIEDKDDEIGRLSFKAINPEYLLKFEE